MAKKKSNTVGVYTLKQSPRIGGELNKSLATVQMEGVKIAEADAEAYNEAHKLTGSFYELDAKATKAYEDGKKKEPAKKAPANKKAKSSKK